jgi:hypothetical protein
VLPFHHNRASVDLPSCAPPLRLRGRREGQMAITITVCCRRHLVRAYSLSASALRNCKARPLITSLVFCAVSVTAATAMDRGQFANVPLEVRKWFEHLRSPNGVPCCSYADGHRTGYDMRQGQFWVPIEGEWYPIPSGIASAEPSMNSTDPNPACSTRRAMTSSLGDGSRPIPRCPASPPRNASGARAWRTSLVCRAWSCA